MFVQVRCHNPGHDGRRRAGRFFANGQTYRMEVIDAEKDFRELDAEGNATGKGEMERINRQGLDALRKDPCFSVNTDGDGTGVSLELFGATKAKLAQSVGRVSDLEVEVDRLAGEAKGKDATIAELRAALEAAGVKAPEPKQAEDASDDGKGKGGKPKGAKG